jgi:hypothetical protein
MNRKIIIPALLLAIFATTYAVINKTSNQDIPCVNTYINFGSLDNNKVIMECVPEEGKAGATFVFNKQGIKLSGTDQYGLSVVCRVNGLPDPVHEKCAKMPPENAYWAVLVKKHATLIDPSPKWGWAQTGISEVYLYPGDSVGLVFTENGKVRWPN